MSASQQHNNTTALGFIPLGQDPQDMQVTPIIPFGQEKGQKGLMLVCICVMCVVRRRRAVQCPRQNYTRDTYWYVYKRHCCLYLDDPLQPTCPPWRLIVLLVSSLMLC